MTVITITLCVITAFAALALPPVLALILRETAVRK